ncbi:putative metal chaperone [Candidatus Rhodobacter oscarellae]|uniref:Putative metal chaperone n=1 Tax=Candidatus Rhodobacter oscarellae TaxID=1675527 RepID=A0A0J9E684_9RHOB|nr:CobW family GTP-binding protein [Candidatus Rhodobacter lobularis]KMW57344.1 putative metal chaperone [Candidatus Rhodobacter lobularis]
MSLPVTVIGGYLGAGKTTLINRLLRQSDGARLAILVNEFGALPIDADLIEQRSDRMIALAGGCICCSFGDNLVGALQELAGLSPAPHQVIIEASGVSIPSAIAASVSLLPGFRLFGTVVLADAETVRGQAEDPYIGDTITRQLGDADLVLLTKCDLVAPDAVGATSAWVAEASNGAPVIAVTGGAAPREVLLDLHPSDARPAAAHADAQFDSLILTPRGAVDADAMARALASKRLGVVRAKGFVLDAEGALWAIQVTGRRWAVTRAKPGQQVGVVCIGPAGQLDDTALQALLD